MTVLFVLHMHTKTTSLTDVLVVPAHQSCKTYGGLRDFSEESPEELFWSIEQAKTSSEIDSIDAFLSFHDRDLRCLSGIYGTKRLSYEANWCAAWVAEPPRRRVGIGMCMPSQDEGILASQSAKEALAATCKQMENIEILSVALVCCHKDGVLLLVCLPDLTTRYFASALLLAFARSNCGWSVRSSCAACARVCRCASVVARGALPRRRQSQELADAFDQNPDQAQAQLQELCGGSAQGMSHCQIRCLGGLVCQPGADGAAAGAHHFFGCCLGSAWLSMVVLHPRVRAVWRQMMS